ncbi:MAG TPA: hypothetical protein VG651_08540 [Stellaceae bacterium]|nr:hypothetical protein [Stellaceae bacterium]
MAVSTSDLTTLRDALVKARASGVLSVRDSDGSEITYKTDAQMAAAIAALNAQIADAGRPQPVSSIVFKKTSKGLV